MKDALALTAHITVIIFAVSSMLAVGLSYDIRAIVRPLRESRAIFRPLIANLILVPLLAIVIEWTIPLEPSHALGLVLLAGAPGAPFLVKLASTAGRDLALTAALLLLLVPATVVFLPDYVSLAMAHPSFRDLTYLPASRMTVALPLLLTMMLPLALGLIAKVAAPRWSARLAPPVGKLSTITLGLTVVTAFAANVGGALRIMTTGALPAALLLVLGAFGVGYLLARPDRSILLGLGTAQRNIAAAMVVASSSFTDPEILVMVAASSLVALLVLFAIAWVVGRRLPHVGPPMPPEDASTHSGASELE